MRYRLMLFGLCLLASLGPRRLRAQQPDDPPGFIGPVQVGRPLRLVEELARVPLPPGGLIPFRQGAYWGYADTTGRVWIEPVLQPEPPFFVGDVVALYGYHLPAFRDPKQRDTSHGNKEPYTFWLNAHGEFLAVDERGEEPEAALLLPGGRLRAGRVADHLGEPALTMERRLAAPQVRPAALPPASPPFVPSPYEPVGEGRFAYTLRQRHYRLVEVTPRSTRNRHGHYHRYHAYRFFIPESTTIGTALVDSAGRPLTEFKYFAPGGWYWHRFRGGWMNLQNARRPPQLPGAVDHGYVLLSRNGREIPLPPAVQRVLPVQDGVALVWSLREAPRPDGRDGTMPANDLGGIIDTTGRWLLPMTGRLSGPDQYGYYRHAVLVGADSVTRFITRRAEPAFAATTFRYAGPFQNGRAWVEAADGRQGLLNRYGQWVTPLRYELLAVPSYRMRRHRLTYLRAYPGPGAYSSIYAGEYPPDSAYLLCRRTGKYGYVARRSGREVIPARYDSVLYHLTGGVACLYRGGRPYVVDARGRELLQAEYRGDWYDYPGHPLHVFRPADARWSVVDTSGRQRLPWLSGTGYYTPDGRAVVTTARPPNQPCWHPWPYAGLIDSLGRVVVPFGQLLGYSGPLPRLHTPSQVNNHDHRWPFLDSVAGPGPGCYLLVDDSTGAQRLLRARDLRPLLTEGFSPGQPPDVESGEWGLQALPGGWYAGRRLRDGGSVLISPAGRQYAAPPGTGWHLEYFSRPDQNPTLPFRYGVERVRWGRGTFGPKDPLQQGYVTPGGRPLWKD